MLYGRLKGVPRGQELNRNVDDLLKATALAQYTDRFACQLSGGNQRKLALAIAMMGSLCPPASLSKIFMIFPVHRKPHELAHR